MESLTDFFKNKTRPGKTLDLRSEYSAYVTQTQSSGETPLPWEEWLKSRGADKDVLPG